MQLKEKAVATTMMISNIISPVKMDLYAKNRRMRMEIGPLIALMIQLTTVKVQMEHGTETLPNQMDTGSSIHMVTLDPGSAMMAKQMVNGHMTMDPLQLELGGSKMTAPGLELLPLTSLMKPSSTIALITKSTCVSILTTEKSTQVEKIVRGTGKPGESVTT